MNYCPCCSGVLLKHIRATETFWFCRHCWQEMPVYHWNESSSFSGAVMGKLLRNSQKEECSDSNVYANKRQSITGWIGMQELSA